MKRKFSLIMLSIVAMCVVLAFAVPQTASADMGPKPSIQLTFNNLPSEECYVTILSKHISTGPHSAYAPEEGFDYKNFTRYDSNYYDNPDYHNEELERIWQIFVDYKDGDGFYFLQLWEKLDGENNQMNWTYYPPYTFKVLLYFPESNTFVTSKIYERYAFDSYYTIDMSKVDTSVSSVQLKLKQSYDYTWEIISLLCRIVLTIAVEMAIALLFRIKGRKPLLTILVANLVTQIALNVALNVLCYFEGALMLIFLYLPLELGVFAAEAITYSIALRKHDVPVWKSIVYALVANVVSGGLGFALALFIPGIF